MASISTKRLMQNWSRHVSEHITNNEFTLLHHPIRFVRREMADSFLLTLCGIFDAVLVAFLVYLAAREAISSHYELALKAILVVVIYTLLSCVVLCRFAYWLKIRRTGRLM